MSPKGTIRTVALAGLAALGLNELAKEAPKVDNIEKLCLQDEDKNRLIYLQTEIREKLESPKVSFEDWQETHPHPEYEGLSVNQIIDEKNAILKSYGYSPELLTWHFNRSKDEQRFSENYISSLSPTYCDPVKKIDIHIEENYQGVKKALAENKSKDQEK